MTRDPFDQLIRDLHAERFQLHPEHRPTPVERAAHWRMQEELRAADRFRELRIIRDEAS